MKIYLNNLKSFNIAVKVDVGDSVNKLYDNIGKNKILIHPVNGLVIKDTLISIPEYKDKMVLICKTNKDKKRVYTNVPSKNSQQTQLANNHSFTEFTEIINQLGNMIQITPLPPPTLALSETDMTVIREIQSITGRDENIIVSMYLSSNRDMNTTINLLFG